MSPFYDDPSLADDRIPYEGLFDAQLRLPLQPRPLVETIVKRDGRPELFDLARIARAIREAAGSAGVRLETAGSLARAVTLYLSRKNVNRTVTVDHVHEAVERVLTEMNARPVAEAYARQHSRTQREEAGRDGNLTDDRIVDEVEDALLGDDATWNATQTDQTLGRRARAHYAQSRLFSWDVVEAHRTGDIYIHEFEAVDRLEKLDLHAEGLRLPSAASPREIVTAIGGFGASAEALLGHARTVVCESPAARLAPVLAGIDHAWQGALAELLAARLCQTDGTCTLRIPEVDTVADETVLDFTSALVESAGRHCRKGLRLSADVSPRTVAALPDAEFVYWALHHMPVLNEFNLRLRPDQALLPLDRAAVDSEPAIGGRVTLNLARAARKSGRAELLFRELERTLELAYRAHLQRHQLLLRLFAKINDESLTRAIATGLPFVVGVTGLNDCIEHITGQPLHESETAMELAEETLARLRDACSARPVGDASPLLLGPTDDPALTTRFDALDALRFATPGATPYTPGIRLADESLDPIDTAHLLGRFQPFLACGHTCVLTVDMQRTSAATLAEIVRQIFCETPCEAVTIRATELTKKNRRDR